MMGSEVLPSGLHSKTFSKEETGLFEEVRPQTFKLGKEDLARLKHEEPSSGAHSEEKHRQEAFHQLC